MNRRGCTSVCVCGGGGCYLRVKMLISVCTCQSVTVYHCMCRCVGACTFVH